MAAVVRRVVCLVVMAPLLFLGSGGGARAQTVDAEHGFVARIAQERSARGLGALTAADDLQVVARRHAQRMADRGRAYHNPDLGTEVQGWSIVAENVGRGPDVDSLHQAFMESQTHRDIILHPDLTQIGVGVVTAANGDLYVVEVFRRPEDQPAAPPPTAPAAAPPVASHTSSATPSRAAASPSTTTTTVLAPAPAPLPRAEPTVVQGVIASGGEATALAGNRPVVVAAAVPDLADVARRVPPAAWAAAVLLAGVVGLQGQVLRRMGLVG